MMKVTSGNQLLGRRIKYVAVEKFDDDRTGKTFTAIQRIGFDDGTELALSVTALEDSAIVTGNLYGVDG